MVASQSAFGIFVSHRHEDRAIAETLRDKLSIPCPNLKVYLSENIPRGADWKREIENALRQSDWLLFIYTQPSGPWDWCMYEAGFFAAFEEQSEGKFLICLHSGDTTRPDPLQKWQSVSIHTHSDDSPEVIQLLKQLFGTIPRDAMEPLNTGLSQNEEELKNIARDIINAFTLRARPTVPTYYNNNLFLSLNPGQTTQLQSAKQLPVDATIQEPSEATLRMFRRRPRPNTYTWRELLEGLHNQDHYNVWNQSLGEALWYASTDKIFPTALPLFESQEDDHIRRFYRPVLQRRDSLSDGGQCFHLIFVEMPPEDEGRPEGKLASVSSFLELRKVLQWGVLKKYLVDIRYLIDSNGRLDPDNTSECLNGLESSIGKIESEEVRLELGTQAHILDAFSESEDRQKIPQLIQDWRFHRRVLRDRIHGIDLEDIPETLEYMIKINQQLMLVTIKEYQRLLSEGV